MSKAIDGRDLLFDEVPQNVRVYVQDTEGNLIIQFIDAKTISDILQHFIWYVQKDTDYLGEPHGKFEN